MDIPKNLEIFSKNIRLEEYPGYAKNNDDYKILAPIEPNSSNIFKEDDEFSTQLAKPLLDTVGEAALVAVTDVQGTILYINDKFVKISKYSREELIGQNHRILKSGFHTPVFYKTL